MADARRARAVWVAVAATVLVVGAVAATAAMFGDSGLHHGGPLACQGCDRVASSIPVNVRQRGTYGINVLRNRGSRAAVLDRIAYRRLTPGLDTLHPLALRVGDYHGRTGLAAGLTLGFPPAKTAGVAQSVRGAVVAPHRSNRDDVELLLGFRPMHKGVFSYDAVDVYYHVGKRRYVARYWAALKVCAPTAAFIGPGKRRCEPRVPS